MGQKSKLLVLSEYVNKTEKIGMWTNTNIYRENEALSDIFTWNISCHKCSMFKFILWLKAVNEITARQTRTGLCKHNVIKVCSIEGYQGSRVKGQHGRWYVFIYRETVGFIRGSYSFYCTFYCYLCCADVREHCGQTWVLLVFLQRTFMVQLDKFTFWTYLHFDLAGHFCLPVPTYHRLTVVTVQWFFAVPASAYRLN